eukprot:PhM_4_TR3474/c1_g2_i1/m.77882
MSGFITINMHDTYTNNKGGGTFSCLLGSERLVELTLPSTVAAIRISNGFLYLDLSPLTNVTKIGNNFLHGCSRLTSLDLSPLANVRHIGSGFLDGCGALTSLDLSPLKNVTQIGVFFLHGCTALTSLD